MSISLDKKTGINLKKGNAISLEKEGNGLEQVCIGLNWGAIVRKSFFGLMKDTEKVDLDGAVMMVNAQNELFDLVYYKSLKSKDGSVKHSGDDRSGDAGADDNRDNEVIEISLKLVSQEVTCMYFLLHSYKKHDFGSIPYSKIRVFEGNKKEVINVMATFNLSSEPAYADSVAMLMGKLVRTAKGWDFKAMGSPLPSKHLAASIEYLQKNSM